MRLYMLMINDRIMMIPDACRRSYAPVYRKGSYTNLLQWQVCVTSKTMVAAIMNEIEKPQFICTRFTVCNQ